ncbi:MAG: YbhB/YbcL family Raf kinase inhibitor-like protein [Nanoarchaeota archaeon]
MKTMIFFALFLLLFSACAKTVPDEIVPPIAPPSPESAPDQKPEEEAWQGITEMKLTSSAFEYGGSIPEQYTCDGRNINPPLKMDDFPSETRSFALIMEDPDAPVGTFVHWIVWDLSPESRGIPEKAQLLNQGMTSFNTPGYGGPCPPSGTHRYFFKVYALDTQLNLPSVTRKNHLEQAMQGHILAEAELMGTYERGS